MDTKELIKSIDTASLRKVDLASWRKVLCYECQVYVFEEAYIGKKFDQINYRYLNKSEAEEILIDNLYALLRFKYFTKISDSSDEQISKIIKSFTRNIKTTLIKVSYNEDTDANLIKPLPPYTIAFKNGVYNFKDNEWFFKYDIVTLENLSNRIYLYDPSYVIMWYVNIDFEPLDIIDINSIKYESLIDIFKEYCKEDENYCFKLCYNMAHDNNNVFSIDKFRHLCQIIGYTLLQSFSQYFVLFIGSGQNGKNSLFDGCFTHKLIPRPAANDLRSIEEDRFITGALENKSHNIFLESDAKTYTDSKMIKALTGSMYQTIEQKGENKYSSIINCKFIFSANDQDKVKFSDTTVGFRRRINMFEVFYRWDSKGRYLKEGDYYNIVFSDSLEELKNNNINIITYIYLGMMGIIDATNNFKSSFKFTYNNWNINYTDLNLDLKNIIEKVTIEDIYKFMKNPNNYDEGKYLLYDMSKKRIYQCYNFLQTGNKGYDDFINMLSTPEEYIPYFSEYDNYINLRTLQKIVRDMGPSITFTQNIRKLYNINKLPSLYNNQPYAKCTFINGKLKLIS